MPKDKLIIDSDRDGYFIAWFISDVDDIGATLGEETYTEAQLTKAKSGDWEHIKATVVAGQTSGVERHGSNGYRWESLTAAKRALRAINAALKDKSGKTWPEWAVKAKAAGWTPPKGWTP